MLRTKFPPWVVNSHLDSKEESPTAYFFLSLAAPPAHLLTSLAMRTVLARAYGLVRILKPLQHQYITTLQ